MTEFQIVKARASHCGKMSRLLRAEHMHAIARVGANTHQELRSCFDQSTYKRSWLIDGRLAAIGGVIGGAMEPYGVVWLAMTDETRLHSRAVVREACRQLAEIMVMKRELAATVIGDDHAALRLAVFLGFHVEHKGDGQPAESRAGRRTLLRHLGENPDLRRPIGGSYVVALGYHAAAGG